MADENNQIDVPVDESLLRQQKANADAKKRKSYLLTGVLIGAAILIILVYWSKTSTSTKPSVVKAPTLHETNKTAFSGQSPKYAQQVTTQNENAAQTAQNTGNSFVATPVAPIKDINSLGSTAPLAQLNGLTPQTGSSSSAPQPKPVNTLPPSQPPNYSTLNAQNNANQQLAQAMAGEIQMIEKNSTPVAQETALIGNPEQSVASATSAATSTTTAQAQAAAKQMALPIHPGDLYYAVMDTALDSDSPGPVMATIVSGKLKNAKALGEFKRENETLVIQLETIVMPDGVTYKIKGYVVDPNTSMAAIETNVDNHYLSRWGGLIAGSFLAGFGQAVMQSGSTTQTVAGPGGTTTITTSPQLTASQELKIAAGETAQKFTPIAQQNFDRPPTVQLSNGTGVGILIISSG